MTRRKGRVHNTRMLFRRLLSSLPLCRVTNALLTHQHLVYTPQRKLKEKERTVGVIKVCPN
jgi:hypothetical protein